MKAQLFCGIDLHKHYSYIVVKDQQGRQITKGRVVNNQETIAAFFSPMKEYQIIAALEATNNYYWLFETLDQLGIQVKLCHPLKTRAIAEAKIKTDKIDAKILSDLNRADLLPLSYIPSRKIRELREIVRHRIRLVRQRSRLKLQLRDVLTKNNISDAYADFAGESARSSINQLSLPQAFAIQCRDILDQIDFLDKKIAAMNRTLQTISGDFPEVEKLMTIRGIGLFSGLVILACIGDIHRFSSPKKLVRYAGLCPGVHQSGFKSYHTSLIKEGDKYLRWILCEAVHHAIKQPGALKDFYQSIAFRRGFKKAIMATARKMLIGIYFVLKEQVAFQPVRKAQFHHATLNLE